MEQSDQSLEQAVRRYRGVIERVYTGRWRLGSIRAASGESLAFRRLDVMGHDDSWTPAVGQAVLFDRLLLRRGPCAVKVRPAVHRDRLPSAGPGR